MITINSTTNVNLLITSFKSQGYTNRLIAEELNSFGIKSEKGSKFTIDIVFRLWRNIIYGKKMRYDYEKQDVYI